MRCHTAPNVMLLHVLGAFGLTLRRSFCSAANPRLVLVVGTVPKKGYCFPAEFLPRQVFEGFGAWTNGRTYAFFGPPVLLINVHPSRNGNGLAEPSFYFYPIDLRASDLAPKHRSVGPVG